MSVWRRFLRLLSGMKLKHFLLLIPLFYLLDLSGIWLHLREKSYADSFRYPLSGDIFKWIEQMKQGKELSVQPINNHDYMLLKHAKGKCLEEDGVHYVQMR